MNRTQLACYTMVATAFVLTALVLLQASRLIDNRAHADMVVNKDAVTMITSPLRADSEMLYILDSRTGRLFAYMLNPNTRLIEPMAAMDISREFTGAAGAAGRGGTTPQRRDR